MTFDGVSFWIAIKNLLDMRDTSVTDGNLWAKSKKQCLYTIKDQYASSLSFSQGKTMFFGDTFCSRWTESNRLIFIRLILNEYQTIHAESQAVAFHPLIICMSSLGSYTSDLNFPTKFYL